MSSSRFATRLFCVVLAVAGGGVRVCRAAESPDGGADATEAPPPPPPPSVQSPDAQQPLPPEPPPPPPNPALDVTVRASLPPRSASEARIERPELEAAPHRTAADLMFVVPGAFVTQHSGEGKAYQIFYRGFDAVHGQDLEIWAGGAPVNDVSNIHGQGYADLQFLPAETVQKIVAQPGTYDPRQGDFAVAGTLRLELGYDRPGFTAKAAAGGFGVRRAFLAYHPPSADERTFAAVELCSTDGFGPARAATRASAVGQTIVTLGDGTVARVMASAYTGRFSSAGVLRLADIESGAVSRFATYDASQGGANGRAQVVGELSRRDDDGELRLTTYLVLRSLLLRHNFTGFLTDPNGDAQQQVNDALVLGATGSYRRRFPMFSPRDTIELGFLGRSDWIEQSQRRLAAADNHVTASEVDARVRARDVAGYADVWAFPLPRLALRLGVRLDGLGYFTQDFGASAAGQARAAQGTHIGKKATVDVRLGRGFSALGSYGEGFRSPQARSLADGETAPFTRVVSGEVGVRYGGDSPARHGGWIHHRAQRRPGVRPGHGAQRARPRHAPHGRGGRRRRDAAALAAGDRQRDVHARRLHGQRPALPGGRSGALRAAADRARRHRGHARARRLARARDSRARRRRRVAARAPAAAVSRDGSRHLPDRRGRARARGRRRAGRRGLQPAGRRVVRRRVRLRLALGSDRGAVAGPAAPRQRRRAPHRLAHACPLPVRRHAMKTSLVAVLLACGVAAGCGESTTGKRVVLRTAAVTDLPADRTFVTNLGWTVTLTRGAIATGAFYYFSGPPAVIEMASRQNGGAAAGCAPRCGRCRRSAPRTRTRATMCRAGRWDRSSSRFRST
jgi:hypothetical protein